MNVKTNTISRGGGGVQFEHRVGADLLNRLLTRSGLGALDDAFEITEVAFQTGDPVDDLRVRASHPDVGLRTLYVAARRKPGLRPSDAKFVTLVTSMLDQIHTDPDVFVTGESRLGLAVRADTPGVASMEELCIIARNVNDGTELHTEVFAPRTHSQPVRDRYDKLLALMPLARPDGTEGQWRDWLWQLLHACHVLSLRLEVDDPTDRTTAIERLGLVGLEAADAATAHAVLETLASGYDRQGATVDMVRLRRDLQPLARVGRSARNSVGWGLIDRLDVSAALTVPRLVRPDGTELSVDRAELTQELRKAIGGCGATAGVLAVTGEPSTGKSALTLAVAGTLADDGEAVIRLNLRDLPGGDTGMNSGLAAVLAALEEVPVAPCRALVIDGCEAVTEGRSRTLQLLVSGGRKAGLGVVVVVREDLLADVLDLVAATDCDRVEVGPLSPAELDRLASEIPALAPAIRSERSRQIVGRIGLAALLVQSLGTDPSEAALSEAMVMRRFWEGVIRRRDGPPSGSSPDDRAAATEAAARAFLGLPAGPIPPGATLERLRLDGVLARPPANTPWVDELHFADDAIRDLAVAFALLKHNFAPLGATAPKWALRAARIAAQACVEEATDIAAELGTLQGVFDGIAATSGIRWSEIPTEALVTVRAPEVTLKDAAAWLAEDQARIKRLVRVLRQRHSAGFEALDPVVATPVLALLADLVGVLPDYGDVADDCTKALLAWLRGLAQRQTDDPCEPRQRYREFLLAKDHHDDDAIEAILLLGPDLGDGAEFLRAVGSDSPEWLGAALESPLGPYVLARTHPDLLIELVEAYYIEEPDPEDGFDGLFENGIRDLGHGPGIGHPFVAAYYGPFLAMLNSKPPEALAAIERILQHALRVTDSCDADPAVEVDLPGLGRREFRGGLGAWEWYRGMLGTGPPPCMSALMAVERFADQLVSIGMPPMYVLTLLLRTATTTPTLGLAVGFAVRHADGCDDFLLACLREPIIWYAESARAASESFGYKAGPPDDDQVVHPERRRWDFSELGSRLTVEAILRDDHQRLDVLRQVGESIEHNARALGDEAEQQARLWATVLAADHYTKVDVGDQVAVQYEPPDWALATSSEQMRPLEPVQQVYELIGRYGQENYDPSALPADIEVARSVVTDPSDAYRPGDAVALVALATVRAHANRAARIKKADVRWAFEVLRDAANECDDDRQWYPRGADRSAATAVGQLLLPAFHESSPTQPVVTTPEIRAVGCHLAANGSDEVRRMVGLGLDPVWSDSCGPGLPGSGECRHRIALDLAERSAQACRLGQFSSSRGRPLVDVPLPLATELDGVPTTKAMLNRLTGAIAATVACALSGCCAADRAMPLAQALVRTHRRVAGHWADSNYQYREWDSEPVAAALLGLADHGDRALLDTALHLAEHPRGLVTLLNDICRLATYDAVQRARMSALWPTLFNEVTLKLHRTGRRATDTARAWWHWGDYALAALIPAQEFNITEKDYDATLAASKDGWPGLDVIADSIDIWLELAVGIPKCVDALARLVWQQTDVTVGLAWIERLIDGHTSRIANRTGVLPHWLEELAGTQLSGDSAATFDRIVDALAAAGDDHVSRLQQD